MEFSQEQNLSEENVQVKLNTEDVELNEDQLEAVAGGKSGVTGGIIGGCTTGPVTFDPLVPPATTSPIDPSNFY